MRDSVPPVALGILGLGPWGRRLAAAFARTGRARIAWLCDPDVERLAHADLPHGARSTTRHEDVLADRAVDAVVVATPPATHAPLALAALDAGKHVFVEKPMATSLAAADELVRAVERTGRELMVGHILTFHPGHLALQRWLEEGAFGPVRAVVCQRWSPRFGRAADDAWWSLAVHDVSVLERLMEAEPVALHASGEHAPASAHLGHVRAELGYASGARALVEASTVAEYKRRRILVATERATLSYDELESPESVRAYEAIAPAHREHADPEAWFEAITTATPLGVRAVPPGEPLALEAAHFLDCLGGAAAARCDVREGWRVVGVLDNVTACAKLASSLRPVRPAGHELGAAGSE